MDSDSRRLRSLLLCSCEQRLSSPNLLSERERERVRGVGGGVGGGGGGGFAY